MVTFVPGSVAELAPQLGQQRLARPVGLPQADVDFSRLDALHVLVVFGPPGAARRRDHLGLRQQDLARPAGRSRWIWPATCPASVFACTVRLPSWKSGRNAVPALRQSRPADATSRTADTAMTAYGMIERRRQHARETTP